MKKVMMVALATLMTVNVWASHLLGGMVGVFQTSQDSTTIGVWLITDPQGVSAPNSIIVEKWEMNSVGWYVQNGTVTLTQGASPISFQGYNLVNYTSAYLDLDSNKYRFIYKNCCWGMINNSQSSMNSEFVISADYWHIPNNSTPYARVPFIINQQVNTRNTLKPIWGWNSFLNEVDNDMVTISQGDLYSGYANGVFVPQIFSALPMTVSNDSISWVPNTLGRYATGFVIEDFRNGQLIGTQRAQWTFMVVNSTIGIEENIKPGWNKIYDWNGNLIYEGERVPWRKLHGLYIHITSEGVEKLFIE